MGHWFGLSRDDGSVSGEAAIGIGVIVMVMLLLVQALGVGMWQLKAHATLAEAIRIATASGEPEAQVQLARDFVEEQLPEARLTHEVQDSGIRFELRQRFRLPAIGWQPLLSASAVGLWQDPWEV